MLNELASEWFISILHSPERAEKVKKKVEKVFHELCRRFSGAKRGNVDFKRSPMRRKKNSEKKVSLRWQKSDRIDRPVLLVDVGRVEVAIFHGVEKCR